MTESSAPTPCRKPYSSRCLRGSHQKIWDSLEEGRDYTTKEIREASGLRIAFTQIERLQFLVASMQIGTLRGRKVSRRIVWRKEVKR